MNARLKAQLEEIFLHKSMIGVKHVILRPEDALALGLDDVRIRSYSRPSGNPRVLVLMNGTPGVAAV
jgi:hypothetical protein